MRFRVLGFPVRVDITFVVVLGFLGLSGPLNLSRLLLWIGIGAVSVLAHELGHALVARTTGAEPVIDLYGFGGVTRYRPPGPLSRARQLSISVAGPLVGITVGLVLLLAVPHERLASGSLAAYAVDAAVFVNLGWGLLNLLPVLPLDGGTVLAELLPGEPDVRRRRAAYVSIVTAVLVAAVALKAKYVFGALLAAWLAFDNFRLVQTGHGQAGDRAETAPDTGPSETDRSVLFLVDEGRVDAARHLVDTLPAGQQADPAVHGLVLLLGGRPRTGRELLSRALAGPPTATRVGVYARLLAHEHDFSGLADLLAGPHGALVPVAVAARAQETAFAAGRFADSARVGTALLPYAGPSAAEVGYDVARAHARGGEPTAALEALARAVDLGWRDVDRAERDPDLAAARESADYRAVRQRMAGRDGG